MTMALITNGFACEPDLLTQALVVAQPTMSEIHSIIRNHIEQILVPTFIIPCPIHYDNAKFTAPQTTHWLRASIKTVSAKQIDFGGKKRRFRVAGLVQFQLFAPIQLGDGGMNEISDLIMNAFRGINAAGVRFRTPRTNTRRRFADEWMILINCPFEADQLG